VTQLHELVAPIGPRAPEGWYPVQGDWHSSGGFADDALAAGELGPGASGFAASAYGSGGYGAGDVDGPAVPDPAAEPTVERCVHELFAAQVRRGPDATALIFRGQRVSYAQLNEQANRLAHHLVHLGIGRGELVGVCLERGPEPVAAVLAVLKAGAGFVMLDPEASPDRIDAVLADAGVAVLVTRLGLASGLRAGGVTSVLVDADAVDIAARPGSDVVGRGRPADVACVLFGAGNIRRASGIVWSHRGVVGMLRGQASGLEPGEVLLHCAPVCWDSFPLELFSALLYGATCVLSPRRKTQEVAALVAEHRVSMLHVPANLLGVLAEHHPWIFDTVRQVLTRGAPAPVDGLARLLAQHPGLRLVRAYSPVERMIITSADLIGDTDTQHPVVPLGRPAPNQRVYVLDESLRPVPAGTVGELYMSAVGLAYGYLGEVGLTAARFVANPFVAGERMYRTGHLVRSRPDSEVNFLERTGQ
jgi:amino acid adenylation domain-containing protein